ncbi:MULTISPECIES: hypothetical protein [unclassified Streptomyces]|uniref:hypothetical protein n=1 Tax=unclassified Streptomyces TaxID=2593676 RepID=UPI00190BF102|nr:MULTISPECIES: hypothetical protein [unclassified Streptomyces]MBK3568230.1 hypothetical protein [Streptomyces sp. MBT62]MBK6018582.1 hypothetical protein [Streptomyces sp. MBT53]
MSGIGPVESVDSPEANGSYEVIGGDPPHLTDRWHTLSPRARRAVLAAGAAAVLGIGTILLLPADSARQTDPRPLAPWPANVTSWRYIGLAQTTDSPTTTGFFRFAVAVESGPAVTLRVTGAAFNGLTAQAVPEPSFTVHTGATRRVTVEISVSDCSGLPLNADLAFLDVTLRNTRAIQRHSFIFGDSYSKDLSQLLHRACSTTNARPGPQPSGSARSQNVD